MAATATTATRRPNIAGFFLRKQEAMLDQVRRLCLWLCLLWSVVGLPAIVIRSDVTSVAVAAPTTLILQAWLLYGYRRRYFPAWAWLAEGLAVTLVLSTSGYRSGAAVLFTWVYMRSLYGSLREKMFGGVVVVAVATTTFAHLTIGRAVSVVFTAAMSVVIMTIFGTMIATRDRTSVRQRAVSAAGAALVAAETRAEAMKATLACAIGMGSEVGAAAIVTRKGSTIWVAAAAGRTDGQPTEIALDFSSLPPGAADALQPSGFVLLTGPDARRLAPLLGLVPRTAVALAGLSVRDEAFGLLVLAFDDLPPDDLSAFVPALANAAALTLDRLLATMRLRVVVDHSPDALFLASDAGTIRLANPAAEALLGIPVGELLGRDLRTLIHADDLAATFAPGASAPSQSSRLCRVRGRDGEWSEVEMIVSRVVEHDGSHSLVVNARDVSDRLRLELELRHAQKLESVGRLAAGIAHEINTPIQFVGDNVRFLRDSLAGMLHLHEAYTELAAAVDDPELLAKKRSHVQATAEAIDVGFILEEVPQAVEQTLDGVARVANIVRAMKTFGHPGTEEKTQVDLNEAITSTLVVANNEIKYVADVETQLADMPLVWCHRGDVNQVVLNLVVNAAHAIGSAPERGRGMIRVSTRVDGAWAVFEVADTGTGIPPAIADKVFDPFFTTKEVGTGTGQGLALVRSLVVDRHAGSIAFSSEPGAGTVFTVRLPVGARESAAPASPIAAEMIEVAS